MDRISKMILHFFVGYWFIALFLSIIEVNNIYEVRDSTYLLIYLGLISFILGYLTVKISKNRDYTLSEMILRNKVEHITSSKLYWVILGSVCIYVYSTLIIFFDAVVMYQTLSDVREDYFSGELYGPVFSQIDAFILTPFSIISTPIFVYLLFYKRNIICLLLGFFLLGYESLGGGRFGYIRIFIAIIFLLVIILNVHRVYQRRFKKFFLILSCVLIGLLSVVTSLRTNTESANESHLLEHISSYTAGPIKAFDYSLENDYKTRINGYKYGQLTLSGLTGLSNLFLSRVGVTIPLALHDLTEIKQEDQIKIGRDRYFNALYTANLFFYHDFGIMGMIFFPFIFGMLFRLIIRRTYKTQSFCMIAVLSWLFYVLIMTVVDFWLVDPYVLLSLIVIAIIGNIKKIN